MSVSAFSPAVRKLVALRSMGRCERCAKPVADGDGELHHRLPRGMGGSSLALIGRASNALRLCGACHRLVETSTEEVYWSGWKIKHGRLPIHVPVLLATPYGQGFWLLDDGGNYLPGQAPKPR